MKKKFLFLFYFTENPSRISRPAKIYTLVTEPLIFIVEFSKGSGLFKVY